MNSKAGELFGRQPEDLLGKLYLDEYPAAEGSPFHRAYLRALEEQLPVVFEDYYEPWDRWFENRVYPSKDGLAVFFTEITERKRIEDELEHHAEELETSLARLHLAARIAQMGIWEIDAATGSVSHDDVAREWFWLEPGESIDSMEKFTESVHDDDRDRIGAAVQAALDGGAPYAAELRLVGPNGEIRWLSAAGAVVYDDQGRPVRMLGVSFDITENEQRTELLREALERQRLAADAAGVGVWDVDLLTQEVRADPIVETIFGLQPGTFGGTGDEVYQLIHPDDRERVRLMQRDAAVDDAAYDLEFRVVTPDGKTKWVRSAAGVLRDGDERALRMVGVAIDVTERKRSEEELVKALEREREARALHQQTLDGLGPTMFVGLLTPEGTVIETNRPALEAAGLEREDVIGRPVEETYWWSYSEPAKARLRQAVERAARGESIRYDEVIRARDDTFITIDFSIHPMRDERGQIIYLVPSAREITDRARAESELRSLMAELEGRVEARTREARVARAEAERANAAKSEFLSRMSHELRTPLNAILGFAQLLQLDELGNEQSDSVKQISKAGRHLLELMEDLLDVSKIEAGVLELSLEPVALAEVVQDAIELVRPLADERGIDLPRCPEEAHDLRVLADRQRVLQVALNLFSNAVKYSREGGSVEATCALVEGRVRIEVRDTAPGIPANDLARLFLPFERLQSGPATEGTGLGLSVAKSLVEAMGGSIGAESQLGEGSCFFFELPAAAEVVTPEENSEAGKPVEARTILLVEDNLSNVSLVEGVIGHVPGARLLTAPSGGDGIELALAERPNLILLDLGLPDMSGDDVLRRLQEDPVTAKVPVIIVSADARRATIERMLASGALAYLTKPLDVERLLTFISQA